VCACVFCFSLIDFCFSRGVHAWMFAAVAAGCRLGVCPLPQVRGYEEDGDDADGDDDESTAAGSSDEPDVDAAVTPAKKAKGSVAPPSASKGAKGKASKAKSSGGVHDKAEARGSGDLDSDVIRVHVSDGIAKNPLFFECVYALEDAWVDVVLHFPPSTRKVVGAPRWGRQRLAQPAPGAQEYPPCTHRILLPLSHPQTCVYLFVLADLDASHCGAGFAEVACSANQGHHAMLRDLPGSCPCTP
jgi:hypothetical protein